MLTYIPPIEQVAREAVARMEIVAPELFTKGYAGELADIVPFTRIADPDEKRRNKKNAKQKRNRA